MSTTVTYRANVIIEEFIIHSDTIYWSCPSCFITYPFYTVPLFFNISLLFSPMSVTLFSPLICPTFLCYFSLHVSPFPPPSVGVQAEGDAWNTLRGHLVGWFHC